MPFNDYLNRLYTKVMELASSIIIKRTDKAEEYETISTYRNFEVYRSALQGDTNFYTNVSYDDDILMRILPYADYVRSQNDLNSVPYEYREAIVKEQNKRTIENFEEMNDYYRVYLGLPPVGVLRFVYVNDIPEYKDIPVHMLNDDQINDLIRRGILPKLIEENPDKPYLKFLGINKIPLLKMRLARIYDIIKIDEASDELILESFRKEYFLAQMYTMRSIYKPDTYDDNDLYHASVGLVILGLAIRNTLSPDNYIYMNSEEMLDQMLRSYNLYSQFRVLPFTYKKRLILMMDELLANKGTDKIVSMICDIFNYDSIVVNRYYMMRLHNRDENGDFIFPKLPSGAIDNDKQYNLMFSKVNVNNTKRTFDRDFETIDEVINNDPLWQTTEEGLVRLKGEDFTSMMSEYLSIDTIYLMNEMMFETTYFINLLLDLRYETESIYVNNMYSGTGKSDCFTMIIFILSLMAKRFNYDGNIIYEPIHIAEIYKFNLENIESKLGEILDNNNYNYTVSDFLMSRPGASASVNEVVSIYNDNKRLYMDIMERMLTTTEYEEYVLLEEIRRLSYVSAMQEKIFAKTDDTAATTYLDMLNDLDVTLYDMVVNTEGELLDNLMIYALEKMENVFNDPSLTYLFTNMANIGNTLIASYLELILDVFKETSTVLLRVNSTLELDSGSLVTQDKPVRAFDKVISEFNIVRSEVINVDDIIITETNIVLNDYVYVDDQYDN